MARTHTSGSDRSTKDVHQSTCGACNLPLTGQFVRALGSVSLQLQVAPKPHTDELAAGLPSRVLPLPCASSS